MNASQLRRATRLPSCPSWARTRTLLIQSPSAQADISDNLLGFGHFPSSGARITAVVCPLMPGETTAKLRRCSRRLGRSKFARPEGRRQISPEPFQPSFGGLMRAASPSSRPKLFPRESRTGWPSPPPPAPGDHDACSASPNGSGSPIGDSRLLPRVKMERVSEVL